MMQLHSAECGRERSIKQELKRKPLLAKEVFVTLLHIGLSGEKSQLLELVKKYGFKKAYLLEDRR
jgi:hypothetical protein